MFRVLSKYIFEIQNILENFSPPRKYPQIPGYIDPRLRNTKNSGRVAVIRSSYNMPFHGEKVMINDTEKLKLNNDIYICAQRHVYI